MHGVAPSKKMEGGFRLVTGNRNGINTVIKGNKKLEKAKDIIDDLEADMVAIAEYRVNGKHKRNRNGFRQMFQGGDVEMRAITAHNMHENVSKFQDRGTSLILCGTLVEQYDSENSGKDGTGLGRWVSMVFRGKDRLTTRVICGYNPCYNNKKHSGTFYWKNRRYFITKKKDRTCPRKRFRIDLVTQLEK